MSIASDYAAAVAAQSPEEGLVRPPDFTGPTTCQVDENGGMYIAAESTLSPEDALELAAWILLNFEE